jgi:molybdate transport system substrate-binding protein
MPPLSSGLRLLAVVSAWLAACSTHAAELTVSAASSLTNALRDVVPLFEAAHAGTRVNLNLGASGTLLAQMTRGAPVDVFVSADAETMDQAQARGLVRSTQRRELVANTLVVVVPGASGGLGASGAWRASGASDRPGPAGMTPAPVGTSSASSASSASSGPNRSSAPRTLADLTRPGYARIAIGLPASVPAGRYTQAALEAAQLWGALKPRMIGAQTVRQALDYVARGEADAGFVYATDAALMPGKVRVAFAVPTVKPILYPVAPLAASSSPQAAARFVEFLFTPAAQAVFARHGFSRP